jgi:hypothetical protein
MNHAHAHKPSKGHRTVNTSTSSTTNNTIPPTLTPASTAIPQGLVSETAANDPSLTDPLTPLRNRIFNEDCLVGMDRIPDQSIDMVLCDLPYGTTQNPWDTIIPLDKLWDRYKRVLKPNAAVVLTAAQPFTTILINSNIPWFKYLTAHAT